MPFTEPIPRKGMETSLQYPIAHVNLMFTEPIPRKGMETSIHRVRR